MEIREPNLYQFAQITQSEDSATTFARNHGLLLSAEAIRERQVNDKCLLGKEGCHGTLKQTSKYDAQRQQTYNGFRCSGCLRFRSAKNAVVNDEVRGTTGELQEQRSFFSTTSIDDKCAVQARRCCLHIWLLTGG
jgi:hypothetical protein